GRRGRAAVQLAAHPAPLPAGEHRMILAFFMLFAGGMLICGAWSFYRSKKPWWAYLGVLLLGLLCFGISIWRIQTGLAPIPPRQPLPRHPDPDPAGTAPHPPLPGGTPDDRSRARAAPRRRRAGRP